MSFSSTCTCSRMTSLAEIEAGAYIRHDCLAYVLQEADNVGGTSLFFFFVVRKCSLQFLKLNT